ncbi:MAG: radical SAM protein [Bacteroidales bacterium]|nr:radical SAM protein [Bacteroidales bacterium]
MMREETVFGPIRSRRLGASLGINLLPTRGKLCNFDCIYCECGWNRDGLADRKLPSAGDVESALKEKLQACAKEGTAIDSITFSGDGEPTLHPDFAAIVDITLRLRDSYFPKARVSVLSNATRLLKDEVFEALSRVDNPILKLDAPDDERAALINRPVGEYHVSEVIRGMERFKGNFILQTMFLKADGWESGEWVQAWADIVRKLTPREIMVYTIDRETPMKGLRKYSVEEMTELVRPLINEGFNIQIKG